MQCTQMLWMLHPLNMAYSSQVDRLQQELAKSEQRAEGDHASVQTLIAKAC